MNENRIAELEKRIQQLEKEVRLLKGNKSYVNTKSHKEWTTKQKTSSEQENTNAHEPVDWEYLLGKVWLPRIFVFVLIIGVIWGFKATFDKGFITEPIRVVLGYMTAAGFVIIGEIQVQKSRERLGQVLIAGSVLLLMLSTFAAHILYGYFPFAIAALLNILWIAAGVFFSYRHQSQALAVLSSAGGFLIPFLLESNGVNIAFFVMYEVLLYGVFLYYAVRNNYTVLHYVSFWLLHAAFVASMILDSVPQDEYFVFAAIAQHLLLLWLFIRKIIAHKTQLIFHFSSFIVISGWVILAVPDDDQRWYYIVFGLFYAILSAVYFSRDRNRFAISISISTFAFMFSIMDIMDVETNPVPLLVEGTIALWLGLRLNIRFQKIIALFPYGFGLIFTFSNFIERIFSLTALSWTVMVLSLFFITDSIRRYESFQKKELLKFLLFVNILLPLIWITQISYAASRDLDLNMQHMFSSFAWAIYAVGFIIYGIVKQSKTFRLTGIALLFATLVKVIGIDLSDISLEFRAILFTVLGGVGLGVSRMIYVKGKSGIKKEE